MEIIPRPRTGSADALESSYEITSSSTLPKAAEGSPSIMEKRRASVSYGDVLSVAERGTDDVSSTTTTALGGSAEQEDRAGERNPGVHQKQDKQEKKQEKQDKKKDKKQEKQDKKQDKQDKKLMGSYTLHIFGL